MACEVKCRELYHGIFGVGARLAGWNLPTKLPFLVLYLNL